jgi:hypothetical protein
MRLNDDKGDNSLAWTLFTLLLAAIALVAMVYVVMAADNTPPEQCLTREQAKEKYPGMWLYWRTEKRCWYGAHYAKPVRTHKSTKLVPTPVYDDAGNNVRTRGDADIDIIQYRNEAERRLRTCCWPPLPAPTFVPWDERIGK